MGALQEPQLHQRAQRQGVPREALDYNPPKTSPPAQGVGSGVAVTAQLTPNALRALPRKTFVPLIVACGFPYRGGVEAPVAIVHHRDSHRNLGLAPYPAATAHGLTGGGVLQGR